MTAEPGSHPEIIVTWATGSSVAQVERIPARGSRIADDERPLEVRLVHDPSSGRWDLHSTSGDLVPLPPFDESPDRFESVLQIPGVDVRWSWTYTDGPCGPMTCTYTVESGRPTHVSIQDGSEPEGDVDVSISFPYHRGLQVRQGAIGLFDVIAPPGTIDGDIDVAMVLAGLITPKWTSASPLTATDLEHLVQLNAALGGRRLQGPDIPTP